MTLVLRNLDINFDVYLLGQANGYLKPYVLDAQINFGESYVYDDNLIVAFFMS